MSAPHAHDRNGLRIAMLTTFYPPYNFGGDGIGIQRLVNGLLARGHEVCVIHDADAFLALHKGPPPAPAPKVAGLEVHALRSGAGVLSPLLTQQLGRPVLNGRRIRAILERGRFDVVNFHNVSLLGGPGLFKYGAGVKLSMAHEHWLVCPSHVLWRHDRELCDARECLRCQIAFRRPPQLWRWTGLLERELRHVDAFIAMSEFSRAKHREMGFPRDMEVMPYFLPDPSPQDEATVAGPRLHERPYFLFVGRLEKIKGLDGVIPLFAKDLGADLVIAGDGEHAGVLRALGAQIPAVRFLGRVDQEALRRLYRDALALIVPSVCFETFGIILIEAFRQGAPVIARRLGPFPEIVEKSRAGELFSSDDELLSAMARLRDDPTHRARLAAAGRAAYLEHWSESAVLPHYLELVRRIATSKGMHSVAERAGAQPRQESPS
jgi:glycosyltransferase involved in cell wall biosynthesis